jgi:hypothetical protein
MADMPIGPLSLRAASHYVGTNKKKIGNALGQPAARVARQGRRTMAYDISLDRVPRDSVSSHRPARPQHGVLRRWLDAIMASRQRQADREIARYIAGSGGITDSVEREIERRFLFTSADERR